MSPFSTTGWLSLLLVALAAGCGHGTGDDAPPPRARHAASTAPGVFPPVGDTLRLSDAEWRERLTDPQYHVLREHGTERAGTGRFAHHHEDGIYTCGGCGAPLFASQTKFESGTGWPSFHSPYEDGRVDTHTDLAFGMVRTEVRCARCDGHLGHVFRDGPPPTGLRYCINSAALDFVPAPREE